MEFSRFKPYSNESTLPLRSAEDVAGRLGITVEELADLSGIDRRTMRSSATDPYSRRVVHDVVRVASLINRALGDLAHSYAFIARRPILALDGRTALQCICLGHADAVIDTLSPVVQGGCGVHATRQ
jgi:hypothetical protein